MLCLYVSYKVEPQSNYCKISIKRSLVVVLAIVSCMRHLLTVDKVSNPLLVDNCRLWIASDRKDNIGRFSYNRGPGRGSLRVKIEHAQISPSEQCMCMCILRIESDLLPQTVLGQTLGTPATSKTSFLKQNSSMFSDVFLHGSRLHGKVAGKGSIEQGLPHFAQGCRVENDYSTASPLLI